MKGTPQDFMHVGIVHFMLHPRLMAGRGPLVETLRPICEDDYFRVVEVTSFRNDAQRKEAVALLQETGMRVFFGAQPVILRNELDLHHPDPPQRRRALDMVKEALAEAIEWHAGGFAVLAGPDPGDERRPQATEMLIGALKEICEMSRSHKGPPVLLENFDRQTFGKNRLVGDTREARFVAHSVVPYYPRFGLMIDLSHMPLLGEDPAEAVRTAEPYLRHVHIGNCVMRDPEHPAYGDEHPFFGTEGGEVNVDDLAMFLRALLEIGYISEGGANVVSFEIKPYGSQTAEDVLDNAKTTLDNAWKRL